MGRPATVTITDTRGHVTVEGERGGYPNLYTPPPASSPNVEIDGPPVVIPAGGPPETIRRLPATVHMDTYRGDDVGFSVAVWDEEGQPADLDGATAASQVRAGPDAGDVLGDISVEIDGYVLRCRLHHEVSAALPARAVYDVEITFADGWRTTLAGGTIAVSPDVTRTAP